MGFRKFTYFPGQNSILVRNVKLFHSCRAPCSAQSSSILTHSAFHSKKERKRNVNILVFINCVSFSNLAVKFGSYKIVGKFSSSLLHSTNKKYYILYKIFNAECRF